MDKKLYYLDNATTTFLSADVYRKMLECYSKCQANSASIYSLGRASNDMLTEARAKVAKAINVNGSQVYYINVDTNGGEIPEDCWEDWD